MQIQQYNKATATLVSGAVVALIINFVPTLLDANGQAGLHTLISFGLVAWWQNK